MIVFVPFEPSHIDLIRVQPEQKWELESVPVEEREELANYESWSGFRDGECIGCAGIIDLPGWPHRAIAWALIGDDVGRDMIQIVRFVRNFIATHPTERIEINVDCEFENGHRFAELLGFKLEAPRMVKYGHGGRDMALYARVN
jgi:hypothetical protein